MEHDVEHAARLVHRGDGSVGFAVGFRARDGWPERAQRKSPKMNVITKKNFLIGCALDCFFVWYD